MKILLLTNLYPFAQAPTRGMYHVSVFRALSQHCETRLVVPLPWWIRIRRPGEFIHAPRENTSGIDAIFPTYWTLPRIGQPLHGFAMYLSLRSLVKKIRKEFPFDAIFASWAYPDAVAAARLARDFNCPLITNVLGSDINALAQDPRLRPQIKSALLQSHRVIAVSHALKASVVALGIPEENVMVQHNGVDGEKFRLQNRREVRNRLGLPLDRKIILFVGNWVPEKGVDVLVEAMQLLKSSSPAPPYGPNGKNGGEHAPHPHHTGLSTILRESILHPTPYTLHPTPEMKPLLALVGSGKLEPLLRELVSKYGLEEQVQFCGRKSHMEIPDWMAAADVFCLPSLREGCPNVILESLSCGRPVVASRVGGIPELLTEENGIMVSAGDASALAEGLRNALERNWNEESLRSSIADFSWDEVGRNYFAAISFSPNNEEEIFHESTLRPRFF